MSLFLSGGPAVGSVNGDECQISPHDVVNYSATVSHNYISSCVFILSVLKSKDWEGCLCLINSVGAYCAVILLSALFFSNAHSHRKSCSGNSFFFTRF